MRVIEFIKKHPDFFTVLGLCLIFYFIFFHNIGTYALMDVDETRYVAMARDMLNSRDFLTLKLNGEYFFEKPPLYFWGECLSFLIFKQVSEFSARFPVCLYGALSSFLLYFTGKRVISRSYGVISTLILATSVEFMILSKFAILDILLSTCVGFSIYCGFLTYFCKEENKKHWWWLFYIFSGLAVLAKGIPGFVIPFGTMFFASIISKRFKEACKPQHLIVGLFVFFSVIIPWHYVMLQTHDPLFFNEYIMKHHILRFVGSEVLGRVQPWYFYLITIIVGLLPWTISIICALCAKIKDLKLNHIKNFDFNTLSKSKQYLVLNSIGFLVTLLFFSISKTKLITYILPIYFFTSCLIGWIWYEFITLNSYEKPIKFSIFLQNIVFIICGTTMLFLNILPLPKEIITLLLPIKWICSLTLIIFSILAIAFTIKSKRALIFGTYIGIMLVLSAWGVPLFFNLDYSFGQNDLIDYAQLAREKHYNIASFGFGRRYSIMYYYGGGRVTFQNNKNYDWLKNFLTASNSVVIVKNDDLAEISKKINFVTIKTGKKYTLIEGF